MLTKLVRTDAELQSACEVLRQLRPSYSSDGIVAAVRRAQKEHNYQLASVESAGDVLCVAGFSIGFKLAWGRHMYVDDLVTSDKRRSKGAGSAMIDWLKKHARDNGCSQLHLDSGVQRYNAHRFYMRRGFIITSHHFAITDLQATGED